MLRLLLDFPFQRRRENVIFFITDDESPTLGCYGDPIAKTPAIDSLAKDGTVFEKCLRHHRELFGESFRGDERSP